MPCFFFSPNHNMWELTKEEKEKWIREHPILKMVIPMNSEAEENENKNQETIGNEQM